MSGILSHPHLSNDFQTELAIAASAESEVKAKAHPVFVWVLENKACSMLVNALAKATNFKPTPGVEKKPSHWTSAPPGGPDQCAVVLLGLDSKGTVRVCASNAIPKPAKTDEPCTVTFFEQFDTSRSNEAKIKLLHQAVSSVATKGHMDWADRTYAEGQRYRTSPIFLVTLEGDTQHFYATTALVEGPQQTDRSLEWTGRVTT